MVYTVNVPCAISPGISKRRCREEILSPSPLSLLQVLLHYARVYVYLILCYTVHNVFHILQLGRVPYTMKYTYISTLMF